LSPLPATPQQRHIQKKTILPWLLLLIVLLLAALLASLMHLDKPDSVADVQAPAQAVPDQAEANKPVSEPVAKLESSNVKNQKPQAPEKPAATVVETAPSLTTTPEITQSALEPTPDIPANTELRIADMSEMPIDQRQQLPALKLSMHVYSSEADKRFAIIDGQRVNEGSVIGNAVVAKIRQDGVVLSVQGQSYLLPRP
ncbi:MAG: general secretion pathway protein GspB, partial [Arenimonas sp.]